jgi:hypothetical protein
LGAVDPVGFREKAGDATLSARTVSAERAWRVNPPFGGAVTARLLVGTGFPSGDGSWLATQGVRGRQVGVNPLRRAVVAVGVALRAYGFRSMQPRT